jgi:hypothetical protein
MPKPCRICFRTCPARSNKSAPTAPTISGNATTRSTNTARRPPSPRAKAQRFGGAQTQRPNAMCVMRIYGASEKSGASSGSARAIIIAGVWPQTQVFRFKTIFGDRLQTRQVDNQFKELMLSCNRILRKFILCASTVNGRAESLQQTISATCD